METIAPILDVVADMDFEIVILKHQEAHKIGQKVTIIGAGNCGFHDPGVSSLLDPGFENSNEIFSETRKDSINNQSLWIYKNTLEDLTSSLTDSLYWKTPNKKVVPIHNKRLYNSRINSGYVNLFKSDLKRSNSASRPKGSISC